MSIVMRSVYAGSGSTCRYMSTSITSTTPPSQTAIGEPCSNDIIPCSLHTPHAPQSTDQWCVSHNTGCTAALVLRTLQCMAADGLDVSRCRHLAPTGWCTQSRSSTSGCHDRGTQSCRASRPSAQSRAETTLARSATSNKSNYGFKDHSCNVTFCLAPPPTR